MQIVWKRGSITVPEILVEINRGAPNELARTTVLKQVQRLEKAGYLERDSSRPAKFSARVSESEIRIRAMKSLTESFFQGSPLMLARQLFDSGEMDAEEIKELRQMIDRAESS